MRKARCTLKISMPKPSIKLSMQPPISTRQPRVGRVICLMLGLLIACAEPSFATPPASTGQLGPSKVMLSLFFVVMMMGSLGGKRAGLWSPPTRQKSSKRSSPTLDRIGTQLLSADFLDSYFSLLTEVESLLAFTPSFKRPSPKIPRSKDARPSRFIVPPDQRMVPETQDRTKHFFAALQLDSPEVDWHSKYELPQACKDAITVMLDKRQALPRWRRSQIQALQSISKRARPLTRQLKDLPLASASVTHLEANVRNIHVAMLCLFCDALQHPDVDLPLNYLRGFNVTGIIAPSNVLRPLPTQTPDCEFWHGYHATMRTNDAWAEQVAQQVATEVRTSTASHQDILREVWQLTKNEIQDGFAGTPMTLHELRAQYGQGEHMTCRVIKRHGVKQGFKQMRDSDGNPCTNADGSPILVEKIRLIDDCKRSKHNEFLQKPSETINPCRFTFMAYVCQEVVRQAKALGRLTLPTVVFSLDDQKSAYRQIPTRDPEMCIVCVYSFDRHNLGPRFVPIFGHNFGHTSSVCNYNRTPLLCCQIARHFLAIPQEAYFDDFNTPDFKTTDKPDSGAAEGMHAIHSILGLLLERRKHQPPATANAFLGVITDVSQAAASDPYVEFRPAPGRIQRIRAAFHRASRLGLSPHAAQVLIGKLGFLLHAAWGKVGRAALQPLVARAGIPSPSPADSAWTPQLAGAAAFFDLLFQCMPPLRWYLARPPQPRLVVYCDAQYSLFGRKGVGVIIADTATGNTFIAGDVIPPTLLDWMATFGCERQTHINQCELLAILTAILSAPESFQGRDVLIWTDNVGSLSACVHGYSKHPDMAALSNAIHLSLARLQARAYFAHVPGLANPADIPSRVDFVPAGDTFTLNPGQMSAKDAATIASIKPTFLPLVFPTRHHLEDLSSFTHRPTEQW